MINTNTTEIKSNSIQKESYTYIGVDLSAKYLDVWVEDSYKRYTNDNEGLKELQHRIAKINGQVLVACEATGSISLYFCEELDRMEGDYSQLGATLRQIQRSGCQNRQNRQ